MNSRSVSSTVILFSAMLLPLQLVGQSQTNYVVTNLGTLGGSSSSAISINNNGLISGFSFLPGDQTEVAVIFENGAPVPLGTLGGPNSAVEWPNHNARAVVGIAETADLDPLNEAWSCSYGGVFFPTITGHICLGFVYQNGTMNPLPTLGGINGYAAGANDLGQVVGWAETPVHDPTCVLPQVLQFEAVIWGPNRGQVQPLPPLGSDPDSAATAINNKGQVVGISGICENAVGDLSAMHAVLWENGAVTYLGSLGADAWDTPTAINNQGQVVGFAETAEGAFHGFFWTKSAGIQDLKPLPGDALSFAYAINDRGQIVGQSIGPNGSRAVIWENEVPTDLNCLTVPNSLHLIYANDINNSGRITGQASDPAHGHAPAFLAVPTPGGNHCSASSGTLAKANVSKPILPRHIEALLQKSGTLSRLGLDH
jgi:probable HAF family extracellular repeat protein